MCIRDRAWPNEVPVTLTTVSEHSARTDIGVLRSVLHGHPVEARHLPARFDVDAVVTELRLGFGAVVVGCSAPAGGEVLPDFVNDLAKRSPVPVVIVRRGLSVTGRQPPAYGRVLLPVAGTPASRAAQELILNISATIGTRAVLGHVLDDEDGRSADAGSGSGVGVASRPSTGTTVHQQILDSAAERAHELGARSTMASVRAASTGDGILELAERHETDLVVVGATRRAVEGHLFLGRTVERVLSSCDATTIVVVFPETWMRE